MKEETLKTILNDLYPDCSFCIGETLWSYNHDGSDADRERRTYKIGIVPDDNSIKAETSGDCASLMTAFKTIINKTYKRLPYYLKYEIEVLLKLIFPGSSFSITETIGHREDANTYKNYTQFSIEVVTKRGTITTEVCEDLREAFKRVIDTAF